MGLMEEVHELRATINQRDQRMELLEQRIDDLEQCSRADDFIIAGLDTKHCSYARAAAVDQQGEDTPPEELQKVVKFLSSKNIHLEREQISACYTLPSKDNKTKPMIVVQFVNLKHKVEVLRQSNKLCAYVCQ